LNFDERQVFHRRQIAPGHYAATVTGWRLGVEGLGWMMGKPGGFFIDFLSAVFVTINPLAPASIFWNNQLLRSELAVNRLDRKLT